METTCTTSDTQKNHLFPGGESRKFERFSLKLFSRITGFEPGSPTLELMTENISAGGAFFPTNKSLPEGFGVNVELLLKRQSGLGKASKVHLKGRVLRSISGGMAIMFDNRIQMVPVPV